MNEYSKELKEKIRNYWLSIYQQVGLKDEELNQQLLQRMDEESLESKRICDLESMFNFSFGNGQRHLIIGTGTGGLAIELYKRGCIVYGVEPNAEANQIVHLKARAFGMPEENFTTYKSESLPFKDSIFDFVHCFSVIEHVDDVERSISEMVRVIKPNAYIYISTPNYAFPYERHYKIVFPTFLPKAFGYLYLLAKRRPVKFLRQINYVNERKINKILHESKERLIWQRVFTQHPYPKDKCSFVRYFLWRLLLVYLNIPTIQEILIRKIKR